MSNTWEGSVRNTDKTGVCTDVNVDLKDNFGVKHAMHEAAERGNVKELQQLLVNGDPFTTDPKGRTPLHYACGFAHQKTALDMVNIILSCDRLQNTAEDPRRLLNLQDGYKNSGSLNFQSSFVFNVALHIAAEKEHSEVAKILLKAGAVFYNIKNKGNVDPIQLIIKKVPTAITYMFDESVSCKTGDPDDQNLTITFNFRSIIDEKAHGTVRTGMYEMETGLLALCLEQRERKRGVILLNPVVQTFLHLKWKKIRLLLWLSIFYHVIWMLLYTLFIVNVYLVDCPYEFNTGMSIRPFTSGGSQDYGQDQSSRSSDASGVMHCETKLYWTKVGVEVPLLLVVTGSIAFMEIYELIQSIKLKLYVFQLENLGQWILIGTVILTTIPVFLRNDDNAIEIHAWQYQVAAFGIFLAWTLILSQLGKLPGLSTYVEILVKVLKSFIVFMITFVSVLVAFVLSFQILMPKKVAFDNFGWGFLKVLVMMVGEISYDDVFYGEDTSSEVPFSTSTKIHYSIFLAIATIILFNLLVGLTISDIQSLLDGAQLNSLTNQLDQMHLMEKFILSERMQRFLLQINKSHWLRTFLVTQQTGNNDTRLLLDIHISTIPEELQDQIRNLASEDFLNKQNSADASKDESVTSDADIPRPRDTSTNTKTDEELKLKIKNALQEIFEEMKEQDRIIFV